MCVFQVNVGLLQTVVTHLTVCHQGECVGVYCFAVKVSVCVCVCVVCASRCALHCHSVCRCVAICVLESVTKSREWKYQQYDTIMPHHYAVPLARYPTTYHTSLLQYRYQYYYLKKLLEVTSPSTHPCARMPPKSSSYFQI